MTEHPSPDDLSRLDERGREAARRLHEHVLERLDVEVSLRDLPAESRRRSVGRVAAVAAVAALLVGTVAVLDREDDGRIQVDVDEESIDVEPGVLRPLGPRDGKDSVQLPLTVEPLTGLHDGDEVRVTAAGFVPGESVGLVQCAQEAGGDTPEARGGADGCYIGDYINVTADSDGVATGVYRVYRMLTTPLTGTVDCAAEAGRCLVAMGAINDYDRSGGRAIEFATNVEPVTLPTVQVTPTENLADGDIVHVTADGLTPGSFVNLEVCSGDPAACWYTGSGRGVEQSDGDESWSEGQYGLEVDGAGHAGGDVPVWRFLNGDQPGTYVDCAVSRCSLRLSDDTAPPTVPLHFTPGGAGPVPPAIGVEPTTGLAPGDEVVVRGEGFRAGAQLYLSLCAAPVDSPEWYLTCDSTTDRELQADEAGSFSTVFKIPDMKMGESQSFRGECGDDGVCTTVMYPTEPAAPVRCDDVTIGCVIRIDVHSEEGNGEPITGPVFPAVPVPITFR